MKSLVVLLLTMMMLISPFAVHASDPAGDASSGTESTSTESADSAEKKPTEDEEEPDCD